MPCWSLLLAAAVTTTAAPSHQYRDAPEPAARLVATAALSFSFDPAAGQAGARGPAQETEPVGADVLDDVMSDTDPLPADTINVDPMNVDTSRADTVDAGPEPLVPRFGTAGSRRWYIQGGRGAEFDDSGNALTLLGLGYSYFINRDVSINLELNGVGHSQFGEDAIGANFNLLFSWHFLVERDWTLYLDGGAGIQWTTEDVPRLGSKFNWTPQFGVGMSLDVGRDTRVMLGCRWHHQSNANLFDSNPGRDSFLGYIQLNFPF